MSNPGQVHEFWTAIQAGDLDHAAEFLAHDPSLASQNFHPESPHTDGFPLYHAAAQGHFGLVKLLLESGADPDAKLDVDDPRELGMPLLNALRAGHYDVVHLILDYEPTLNAHPYCSTPFVDQLFNNMWDRDRDYQPGQIWQYRHDRGVEVARLLRRSYANYLNTSKHDYADASSDTAATTEMPELLLLRRVVTMGGQPSLFTLVRHEQHDLIRQLLTVAADEQGTPMDWPPGSVFDNICHGASWCGYPLTLDDARRLCSALYTTDVAKHAIEFAIRSHNRDGGIDQYYQLVESQLEFLKSSNAVSEEYSDTDPFCPLHWLAEDFIEPSHYGFKCEPLLTSDDLIRLAKLFVAYGYDVNSVNPKSGLSVVETAKRENEYAYAEYLIGKGAASVR